MLLPTRHLDGIRAGTVTLAFRRWRRPTVRAGGTLLTAVGQIEIASVAPVDEEGITAADARAAGFDSLDDLLRELRGRTAGDVYRVEFGAVRQDPRIALRETTPSEAELEDLRRRLERLDARGADGAWTRRTLEVIAAHPGRRAGDLCLAVGMEKPEFKANVRKLKALGLTESLEVGYRLSSRGVVLFEHLVGDASSND